MTDCSQCASRLSKRLAALLDGMERDSLARCTDLATDVLESQDFAELVKARRLPACHVHALRWAEEVLHESEAVLDDQAPLNSELARSLCFRLRKVDDWLRRLAGERSGGKNVGLIDAASEFRSAGLAYR
jgi:hypothetical protein